ncbi:MAG: hypothetical protein ABIP55_06370, partial [Tepidisphaeraceae bacterium]
MTKVKNSPDTLPLVNLNKEIQMADKKNKAAPAAEKLPEPGAAPSDVNGGDVTNVRHEEGLDEVITELNHLA